MTTATKIAIIRLTTTANTTRAQVVSRNGRVVGEFRRVPPRARYCRDAAWRRAGRASRLPGGGALVHLRPGRRSHAPCSGADGWDALDADDLRARALGHDD